MSIVGLKPFLILTMLGFAMVAFSQVDENSIINGAFPDKWDVKKTLRGKNGNVLTWARYKNQQHKESRSCLILTYGVDSNGGACYNISVKYTNKKPFNKWHFAWTQYLPTSSSTGISKEYFEIHDISFDHKPTVIEVKDLLSKWDFSITSLSVMLIEAGIDEKLWLDALGFIPDRKMLCRE